MDNIKDNKDSKEHIFLPAITIYPKREEAKYDTNHIHVRLSLHVAENLVVNVLLQSLSLACSNCYDGYHQKCRVILELFTDNVPLLSSQLHLHLHRPRHYRRLPLLSLGKAEGARDSPRPRAGP